MKAIENLVFEGGGVKGSAYAGCIQVLDEHHLFNQIKRVSGTSAGAITATLLAIGAGSKGLTESIMESHFHQFVYDKGGIIMDIWRVFRHYGIHSGNSFVRILRDFIKKYTNNSDLTFGQLKAKVESEPQKYKYLSVVASNITTQQPEVFDCERTPDVPIWRAVRASMSIPVLFEPFKINNSYYVDGGLGWIYPIDMYDAKEREGGVIRNPATLGFYLEQHSLIADDGEFNPKFMPVNSLKSATKAMASFLYENANSKHLHPEDRLRTVFVDDLGISSTDFSIRQVKIEELIQSGRNATETFLKKRAE